MMTELCQTIRNWFEPNNGRHFGRFEIANGRIVSHDFHDGQYVRILGSAHNDGVYKLGSDTLTNETFDGAVWEMRPPPAFLSLCERIKEFAANGSGSPSPFVSESFGGYAYTKATDANGKPLGWQDVYANELNQWRKI